MLGWLLLIVPLALATAGSLEDIKTKELPDEVTHFIFVFGLVYRLIWAYWDFTQLEDTIFVTLIFSAFGALMYYAKQWGGGDSKLLAGFATTIAVPPREVLNFFNPVMGPMPFWMTLLINIFITGTLYGTLATFWLVVKHKLVRDVASRVKGDIHELVLGTLGLSVIFFALNLSEILPIILSLTIFSWFFVKSARTVEDAIFYRTVKPEELLLEDWLVEDVVVNGKILASVSSPGVSQEELDAVLKHARQIKEIKIKDGVAFGPTFPLALCATLLFGDITFRAVLLLF